MTTESYNPCWAQRFEVDPRYAYTEDTFDDDAPGLAPACGHDRCLTELALHETSTPERFECTAQTMWDCPISECRYDTIHAMCDLDKGHEGDHRFVSSNEIVLEFGPAPLIQGTAVELPGMSDVPTADTRREKPWTA